MQRRKTHTSSEVKNRYDAKTYKTLTVKLRKDEDAAMIEWLEQHRDQYGITDIFRAGLEALMKQNP